MLHLFGFLFDEGVSYLLEVGVLVIKLILLRLHARCLQLTLLKEESTVRFSEFFRFVVTELAFCDFMHVDFLSLAILSLFLGLSFLQHLRNLERTLIVGFSLVTLGLLLKCQTECRYKT